MAALDKRAPGGSQALARAGSSREKRRGCPATARSPRPRSVGRAAPRALAPPGEGPVPPNPLTPKEDAPMLNGQALEQLQAHKLSALAAAWTAKQQNADLTALSFDERLALLVDA